MHPTAPTGHCEVCGERLADGTGAPYLLTAPPDGVHECCRGPYLEAELSRLRALYASLRAATEAVVREGRWLREARSLEGWPRRRAEVQADLAKLRSLLDRE